MIIKPAKPAAMPPEAPQAKSATTNSAPKPAAVRDDKAVRAMSAAIPSEEELKDRVKEILSEQLEGVSDEDCRPSAKLRDTLGAEDSDLEGIFEALEEEYKIKFPDNERDRISTVRDLVDAILEKLS